jgi:hypothetical protein
MRLNRIQPVKLFKYSLCEVTSLLRDSTHLPYKNTMITFLLEHLTVNLNSTIVASQKNKSMRTFYQPIEQYFGHHSSENADAGAALRCVD